MSRLGPGHSPRVTARASLAALLVLGACEDPGARALRSLQAATTPPPGVVVPDECRTSPSHYLDARFMRKTQAYDEEPVEYKELYQDMGEEEWYSATTRMWDTLGLGANRSFRAAPWMVTIGLGTAHFWLRGAGRTVDASVPGVLAYVGAGWHLGCVETDAPAAPNVVCESYGCREVLPPSSERLIVALPGVVCVAAQLDRTGAFLRMPESTSRPDFLMRLCDGDWTHMSPLTCGMIGDFDPCIAWETVPDNLPGIHVPSDDSP